MLRGHQTKTHNSPVCSIRIIISGHDNSGLIKIHDSPVSSIRIINSGHDKI